MAVLGAGSWGTAFAKVLADAGRDVVLLGAARRGGRRDQRRARQPRLPAGRVAARAGHGHHRRRRRARPASTSSCSRCRRRRCGPTSTAGATCCPPGRTLVSLAKGIELGTLKRMSEVIAEVAGVPADQVAVVSGPNLAREIAAEQPTATVIACVDHDRAVAVQLACTTGYFRSYTNTDVVGCELGGAVKNVIALACGMAAGMGFGDNTRASLITRGLAETARLGVALGADPLTFAGPRRARRPRRHLLVAAVAQPDVRRAAGPRREPGAGRGGQPRAGRRGRQVLHVDLRAGGAPRRRDADHRRRAPGLPRGALAGRDGQGADQPGAPARVTANLRGRRDWRRDRAACTPAPGGRHGATRRAGAPRARALRRPSTSACPTTRPRRLLRPRGQPDLARAGGGDRRARRRRVRGLRLRHGRDRGRAARCGPATPSCCPSDGYYMVRDAGPRASARASPCGRCRPPGRGPTACSTARAWCCWRPRPTPAWTSCDIAALAARRARRGRARGRRQHHRHAARPAPARARRRPRRGQRHQGAHRATATSCSATSAPATPPLAARLRELRTRGGAVPGPLEAWLAHRGLGHARPAAGPAGRQRRRARRGAARAPGRRGACAGRASPPTRRTTIARRQMRRWNGVIGVHARGPRPRWAGSSPPARLVASATSFGGVRTSADRRQRWGDAVPPGFLRLSAGCEDADDLVADVRAALDACCRHRGSLSHSRNPPGLWSDLRREVVA